MSSSNIEQEFAELENHLVAVMDRCKQLRLENQLLKQQREVLTEERGRLIQKNENARTKVEQMIIRLKSLEANQ